MAIMNENICGVCLRRAGGLAFAPKNSTKFIWLCDEDECHRAARKVYYMSKATLDRHEAEATKAGGKWAGSYLDEIEKTDLVTLSAEEWKEFTRRIIVGYTNALRDGFQNEEVPF